MGVVADITERSATDKHIDHVDVAHSMVENALLVLGGLTEGLADRLRATEIERDAARAAMASMRSKLVDLEQTCKLAEEERGELVDLLRRCAWLLNNLADNHTHKPIDVVCLGGMREVQDAIAKVLP